MAQPQLIDRYLAALAGPLVLLAAMPGRFADEWSTGRTTGWYLAGTTPSSSLLGCCWWPWSAWAPAMAGPSAPSGWPA
jgi:hypothetical protein